MPGRHWSEHLSGPDDPMYEHYEKEEDLEAEIAIQQEILRRMENEILAVRMEEDRRIYNIENREIYRQANHRLNLATIALEDQREEHGSYHSLRRRRPQPNILSEEQIAAHNAQHRGDRAPGGSVRRDSRRIPNRDLMTSPIQTPPRIRSGTRVLRIGNGGAFSTVTTPPSTRSVTPQPQERPRSPRRLPPIRGRTRQVHRISDHHTGETERDELQSSPGGNDGRRPGNRNTGTAGSDTTGTQLRFGSESSDDEDHYFDNYKPTLKF